MRYYNAVEVSEQAARAIIEVATTAASRCVVVQHHDRWFDVRGMTASEIDEFIAQLVRTSDADAAAGLMRPH